MKKSTNIFYMIVVQLGHNSYDLCHIFLTWLNPSFQIEFSGSAKITISSKSLFLLFILYVGFLESFSSIMCPRSSWDTSIVWSCIFLSKKLMLICCLTKFGVHVSSGSQVRFHAYDSSACCAPSSSLDRPGQQRETRFIFPLL